MIKFISTNHGNHIQRVVPDGIGQDSTFCTWMELTEVYQKFLESLGYVFEDGFDMAAILQKKNDKMRRKAVQQAEEYDSW